MAAAEVRTMTSMPPEPSTGAGAKRLNADCASSTAEEYDEPEIRLTVLSQTTHLRRTVYEEERALDTAGPKKAAPGKPRAAGMSGYIGLFGKPGNINGILACRIANNLYVPPLRAAAFDNSRLF